MEELEFTWGRVAKVYWALVWRAAVMAAVGGALMSFFFGRILDGVLSDQAKSLFFNLLGIPITFVALGLAIKKSSYRFFRIAVLPPANKQNSN